MLYVACLCNEVRLSGAGNYFEGRVEICSEGQFDTVTLCDGSWDDTDAEVVCSQLGFFAPGKETCKLL